MYKIYVRLQDSVLPITNLLLYQGLCVLLEVRLGV